MLYAFDEFDFDAVRLELRRAGTVLKVDPIVLRVLATLLRGAGALVTKDELVEEVWGGRVVADNVITVSMARLRRALQDKRGQREFVVTVYSRGYRFVRPVTSRSPSKEPSATAPEVLPTPPPLVGRGEVLAELRRGVSEALGGRGHLFALIGEPGIGKSRVASALADELIGGGTRVAWGYCRESGSTPPLYPWLQILRAIFEATPEQAWLGGGLGAVVAELRTLVQESELSTLTKEPVERERDPRAWLPRLRNLGAIVRVFTQAAEINHWVFVLEDLHRADAASLELMRLLIDELARSRVCIIATVREGANTARPDSPLPYVLGHSNTERLLLERLNEDEVRRYVTATIPEVDGRLARAVYRKSQGNPFFMTELTRQIARDSGRDPDRLTLPEAALDIVRQRVYELEPNTRSLLTAAAVIGTRFELPILQMVTGQQASAIAQSLDDAIAADVVVAAPDSLTAFSFGHELLRTVLYDAIAPTERRRRHLETALALEKHAASAHVAVCVSELADHFYAAMPETDLDKTVRYCDEAAQAAGTVFANTDVARHLKHALAALTLIPSPPVQQRMSLLLRLAVYSRGSRPDVFQSAVCEVVRLARAHDDPATMVRAAIMYRIHPELSALPGASDALEHALTKLPASERGLRAAALAALATAAPRAYSAAQSSACLDEAEPLARATNRDESLGVVLVCRLFSQGGPQHDQTTAGVIDELGRITRQNPGRAPMVPLFLSMHRAVRMLQQGDQSAANAAIDGGLARARAVRHPELLWYFERFAAVAKINSGACDEGRTQLERLHRQLTHRPILGSFAFRAFDRAVVLPELGETVVVDDGLRRALAFQSWDAPGIWALKLRALAALGLHVEARSALAAIPAAQLAELPCDSQYLGTLGQLAHAVVMLRSREYAEVLLQLLAPYDDYFAGHAAFLCDGAVPQLRGMLAAVLERPLEARPLLERGLRMSEQGGYVLCAANARIELGKCLLALGQEGALDSARRLASTARVLSERHGLERSAQSAVCLMSDAEATV